MDRVEESLKTSGYVVNDRELNAYVRELVCKLAAEYCHDIRIYIVQTPQFNASMAPNGAMQVWTGVILRARSEAQLAYVLGHEIAHFQRRHSLQMWRDARSMSNVTVFFRVLTSAAGVGFVGDLAALAAAGSMFAFSREQELEADLIGIELMRNAGYDVNEAATLIEALIKEQEAAEEGSPFIFFATHPTTESRLKALKSLAAEATSAGRPGAKGRERYFAATLPFRGALLRDELRQREFARVQVLLDHLFETGVNPGELHFFQGEFFRLRADDGDYENAVSAYQEAFRTGNAPPEAHRSLGFVYLKAGKTAEAKASFDRYLRARPDADDREMIRSYLVELG